MTGAPTSGPLGFPALNNRPIEEGKKAAVFLHQGIMREQLRRHRLLKDHGRRYHRAELLFFSSPFSHISPVSE